MPVVKHLRENHAYQFGLLLAFATTILQSATDGMAKFSAQVDDPFVVMAYGGAIVALAAFAYGHGVARRPVLRTSVPRLMAVRTLFSFSTTVFYILAVTTISLAEAFVVAATMPFASAVVERLIFGHAIKRRIWLLMVAGAFGVAIMFLDSVPHARIGYLWAILATISGAVSILLSREVYRHEHNSFGMLFWPNLTLCLFASTIIFLRGIDPTPNYFGSIFIYAMLLFTLRLTVIVTSRFLLTHVQTAVYNIQFIWVVVIGVIFFDDVPTLGVYAGAAVLITSTLLLAISEAKRKHDL